MCHLREAFEILKAHQYVVNTGKCVLGATKIEYIGHYILAEGVCTDPRKIEAVANWPQPKTVKQVRSFLGLAGYYRRFVKDYGIIARPLIDLLKHGGFN